MAVYTAISDDELREFISKYDLGEVIEYRGIAEGVENSNFFLRTTKNDYILTLYEKRVERKDLPFFLSLMEHLAKKSSPPLYRCVQETERVYGHFAENQLLFVVS